jgi:proline dehydrogenase
MTMTMTMQQLLFPLARRFVAGETADDAIDAVRRLNADGIDATIDMLGEDVHEAAAAGRVRDGYRALIERVAAAGVRTNLSLKLSALGLSLDRESARSNFLTVLDAAAAALPDPFVRIDMEGSALVDATLALFYESFATH